MANRFVESFNPFNQPQNNQENIASQLDLMRQNPNQFLANQINLLSNQGIQVPQEYQNNPEMVAKFLLQNNPGLNQNRIFQTVSALRSMFGIR